MTALAKQDYPATNMFMFPKREKQKETTLDELGGIWQFGCQAFKWYPDIPSKNHTTTQHTNTHTHTHTVASWLGKNAPLLMSLNIGQALPAESALSLTHSTVLNGDRVDRPSSVNQCQEALYIKIHVKLFFLLYFSLTLTTYCVQQQQQQQQPAGPARCSTEGFDLT